MIYYIGYFILHMGRHRQDVSRAKKYTQDVENPINLTRNEKLWWAGARLMADQVHYGIKWILQYFSQQGMD